MMRKLRLLSIKVLALSAPVLGLSDTAGKLVFQGGERCIKHRTPRHDHIILAGGHVVDRVEAAGFFEPPAHTVSNNRVADFFRYRDAQSRRIFIPTIKHFQQKKPPAPFFTATDSQKFGALLETRRGWDGWPVRHLSGLASEPYADSRLRPRLRRAAIMRRPPFVAMRARNPCRRLRTILEG
ncbi:exported protein of unknown function [Nitratireductor aquimarinus]